MGLRAPVAVTKPVACHEPTAGRQKVLRARIAKEFQAEHEKGKAEVTFPCDGLAKITEERIARVVAGRSRPR